MGAEGEKFIEDAIGQGALGGHSEVVDPVGIGGDPGRGVVVGVEAEARGGDVVGDDGVGALAEELGAGGIEDVVSLGGEGEDECAGRAVADGRRRGCLRWVRG